MPDRNAPSGRMTDKSRGPLGTDSIAREGQEKSGASRSVGEDREETKGGPRPRLSGRENPQPNSGLTVSED